MVRKKRTDMPFCICPQCGRSTTVGKLYGGKEILYYCHDCCVEFSVRPEGDRKATCEILYKCGSKIPPIFYKWIISSGCWKMMKKPPAKKKGK